MQNIDVVKGVIDGWLRGDPGALELIAPDVVYVDPPTMPGGKTYHGHEGVLEWVVAWRREWTDAKVIRWEGFASEEDARAAAGLRD